jgi:hypothetical protein
MRSTLFLSLIPSYPTRSAASRGFVLSRDSCCFPEPEFVTAVFLSHPNENNIIGKIIAMSVERSAFFMDVMKKREATSDQAPGSRR